MKLSDMAGRKVRRVVIGVDDVVVNVPLARRHVRSCATNDRCFDQRWVDIPEIEAHVDIWMRMDVQSVVVLELVQTKL